MLCRTGWPPQQLGDGRVAGPWLRDYAQAMRAAERQDKMLLIYFCEVPTADFASDSRPRRSTIPRCATSCSDYVCVQLPLGAKISVQGKAVVLLEHEAFREMLRQAGHRHRRLPQHRPQAAQGSVVSRFRSPITFGTRRSRWR